MNWCRLVVVQLQAHAVVDLVVLQRNVVLEDGVPLLNSNLLRARAALPNLSVQMTSIIVDRWRVARLRRAACAHTLVEWGGGVEALLNGALWRFA